MKCSNCEAEEPADTDNLMGIDLSCPKVGVFAYLCPKCQEGVLTMKIVLSRRTADDTFKFEGYLPVSSVK